MISTKAVSFQSEVTAEHSSFHLILVTTIMLLGFLVLLCASGALASECTPPACYSSAPTSVCSNAVTTFARGALNYTGLLVHIPGFGWDSSHFWNLSFNVAPPGFSCPSDRYLHTNVVAANPGVNGTGGSAFSMRIVDGNGVALFDGIVNSDYGASRYSDCYNFTGVFTTTNELTVTFACVPNTGQGGNVEVCFSGVCIDNCDIQWMVSYSCSPFPFWTPIPHPCNPLSCFQPTTYTCLDSNTSASAVSLCASLYGPTPSYAGRSCLNDPAVAWCGTHQTATVTTYGNNGCSGSPTSSQTMNTNQCYDGVGSSSLVQRDSAGQWRYQVFSAPGCSGSPQFVLTNNDTKADGCASSGSLVFSVRVSTVSSGEACRPMGNWVVVVVIVTVVLLF
jgi:hypothetical protein